MAVEMQLPGGPVTLPKGKRWPPKPKPMPKILKAL
jgi:hypothetical protein